MQSFRRAVSSGLPRTGGGVSKDTATSRCSFLSSPHGRGCFCGQRSPGRRCRVFPARAGVFLSTPAATSSRPGSSPHGRGCFPHAPHKGHAQGVFPARAGVFLSRENWLCPAPGLPRTGGGVSRARRLEMPTALSSPHGRGCFQVRSGIAENGGVFPARAGVFPRRRTCGPSATGHPRLVGGCFLQKAACPRVLTS